MVKRVSKELGIPITSYEAGPIKNGHMLTKKLESKFDVIISQGETAAAIKDMVSIPVVSIETSIADFLSTLLQVKQYGGKVDLVNCKSLKNPANINSNKKFHTKGLVAKYTFEDIIGKSLKLQETIKVATKFGKTSSTILIEGETGSGKELFAQSIHNISSRKDGPFVAINCAALPASLLESELFGYEEGAFTGAKKGGKPGLFELAHRGTIFLDEIGEMPLSLQSRLLRVLQEKEVMRIGADYILNVDTRIIAATNLDLYKMVKQGKFREDLYFRLNILNFKIPPLRERKEDIDFLVKHFIKTMNLKHNTYVKDITEKGMSLLKRYAWPGNVRELEHFIEKMVILANTPVVDEQFIEHMITEYIMHDKKDIVEMSDACDSITVKVGQLKDMELQIIDTMSKIVKGDKSMLAEKLGISRTTLWKKLKELEETADTDYMM